MTKPDAGSPGVDAADDAASDGDGAAASSDAQGDSPFAEPDAVQAQLGIAAVVDSVAASPRLQLLSLDGAGTLTRRAVLPAPDAALHLARSVDGRFLYVLGWNVAAFSVDAATAGLGVINDMRITLTNWSGIAVDPLNRWLIVSDNLNGLLVFALQADGGIGRPLGAAASGGAAYDATFDPAGKFVFASSCAADLVAEYAIDGDTGALLPRAPSLELPGLGPGRVVFHPSGRTVYVMNVKAQSITSFTYSPDAGTLADPETVSFLEPVAFPLVGSCSLTHLVVHPSGRFAYATTAGGNAVAILAVSASGRLTLVGHEQYFLFRGANALAVDPTGTFLLVANGAQSLQVFAIDPSDGRLTFVGNAPGVSGPVAVAFLPPP